MKKNISFWERILRGIIGFLLTVWTTAGGPIWGFIGIYFIVSGASGFCLGYWLIKRPSA